MASWKLCNFFRVSLRTLNKFMSINDTCSGFGGIEVACWPLVPKFAGSNPAEAVGFLRVNKNPQYVGGHGCLSVVIVVCCQVELITRSEESYRLWCVVECDLKTS